METFKYLFPLVSIAPPLGYRLNQVINANALVARTRGASARMEVNRAVILSGEEIITDNQIAVFENGRCLTPEVLAYRVDGADEFDWSRGDFVPYVETHISMLDDGEFTDPFFPAFYTIYSGVGRKTFFSDNVLKFGDTVAILQIRSFQSWVAGYPASAVDATHDIGESAIVINPFLRPALATLEFERREARPRFRVPPRSARRIDFVRCLGVDRVPWAGQVFVTSPTRLLVFFAKHSLKDPNNITTVEHPDLYRGEPTFEPATQRMRKILGRKLKILRGRLRFRHRQRASTL